MTRPFHKSAELRSLLDALCEESITAEQSRRLEELVLAHPEAEAYYVQYLSLYADLISHFSVLPARTEQSLRDRVGAQPPEVEQEPAAQGTVGEPTHSASRRSRLWLGGIVGLAGLAAGLLLAQTLGQRPQVVPTRPNSMPEATDDTVAVLVQAPGAEWEETGLPTRAGAPLPPGWLRLKSGFAHLEFYSGAVVILQAPAEFQLISRLEAYCARGKLRATVPPQAQGFTIRSPKLDLVDRGTEFGLRIDGDDKVEVHVFRGEVVLYDAGSGRSAAPRTALTRDQGVRLDGPGRMRPIKSDPGAFRTAQDLEVLLAEEALRRQRDWLAGSKAVRQDSALLVYYPFQDEAAGSRTLLDQAGSRKQSHDGVIVGCRWGAGRWPGKKGLEFKQVSDRVRFHVSGEFASLTLMAWVRVDALPNRFNSLFMTDGWDDGAPHWHLSDSGKLELGVQGRNKKGGVHYLGPEVIVPERLGQWVHLAVTYDGEKRLVTHYVDGQPVSQEVVPFDIPLRLGDAEIGNWNVASYRNKSPVRYFRGCMDEFLLFSRALGGQEIERLYQQGRPTW
jgi:hypothetical protein